MPGTRRINPVFRGSTPQGPLKDENGEDLVDWLKGIGQMWQDVVKGFGKAEAGATSALTKAGIMKDPKTGVAQVSKSAVDYNNAAAKAMMDYANASMKFGKRDDPRRGRGFKVR